MTRAQEIADAIEYVKRNRKIEPQTSPVCRNCRKPKSKHLGLSDWCPTKRLSEEFVLRDRFEPQTSQKKGVIS